MVRKIPEKIPREWASMPDMQGAWIILQPIAADLQLLQSGHFVSGTYCNVKVKGTIEGTLIKEGEDIVFTGKWSDQLGRGSFSVLIDKTGHNREKDEVGRTFFHGKWKHSQSQIWDGEFVGEKR